MTPQQRTAAAQKVVDLVLQAEAKFPGRRTGQRKSAWVANQVRKQMGDDEDPSAAVGRFFGRWLLRLAIEVSVVTLNRLRDELE